MTTLPEGFVWGTATAAHQVEGGNWNSDWWQWEHDPASRCAEPSGDAVDQWHRYADDIAQLARFGFNAYRFSVEWARVEPEGGEWSIVALDHYRRVCATCRDHDVTPIVTYHHFTTPRWVAGMGGWIDAGTVDRFARYAERVTQHLGDLVGWACTLNEPNVVATHGYRTGIFPPGERSSELRRRANDVFIAAHQKAAAAIKGGPGDFPVGLTLAMADFQVAEPGGEVRRDRVRHVMEDVFLEATGDDDFIGVQTYTRHRFGPDGDLGPPPDAETTQMGYEFYPEALEGTIRRAAEVTDGTPVLVTENGIGTADDARRVEYTRRALAGLGRCLHDGIDVRGYVHWSLLDNFEWALGYRPTFGLVAVDRTTMARTPKPSADWLGALARANRLP
ncbi:MAG TPA: family 1 glycosylhydrolase [Acidimicrobiales bacterium]|nr:family 1 glycosylhydrolase [Acidimicrobiales bacterium]